MNGLRLGVRVGLVGAALVLWVGCGSGKVEVGLFALCDEDHSCSDGMLCSQGQCVTQCGQGWQACEGQCVNLNADAQHCGGCGIACAEGTSCTKGTCDDRCVLPWLPCGDDCVDVAVDSTHCGGCDKPCADDELCEAGDCVARCAGEHGAMCQGACVDTWNDPRHCGGCGKACEAGNLCVEGSCVEGCAPPRVACDGACVDVALDPEHCGDCETVCDVDEICDAGDCVPRCAGEHGEWCGGTCVDTWNDNRHCGYCGVACWTGSSCTEGRCDEYCATPWILCGEACFNPAVDPDHCGDCDTQCEDGQICEAGDCVARCAGENSLLCEGVCVNTEVDPSNCGSCGTLCRADEVCNGGDCVARCAGEHGLMCGGVCADTYHDNNHCGACDQPCLDGTTCTAGKCIPVCVEPLSLCGTTCVDPDRDPLHCGDCDVMCEPDEVCEGGKCHPRCVGDHGALCEGTCVDLYHDNLNCGTCGEVCGAGLTCTDGRCLPWCVEPLSLCDDTCVNLDTDVTNCGECETTCGTNQVCTLGDCICMPGFYDIGGIGDCELLPPCTVFASVGASGDGSSWAAAMGSLQAAIDTAATLAAARLDGQCMVFATAGEYDVYQSSGADTLLLKPGVLVAGGFAGTETTLEERAIDSSSGLPIERSVLAGRSADGGENVRHVLTGASNATIDGFVITGGRVSSETVGEDGYGAGLVAVEATGLVARRCIFEDNVAPNGGAIAIKGGDLTLENVRFSNNTASKDGGAIMARGASKLVVTNALFERNMAPNGVGGAICSADTVSLVVSGTSFSRNGARWEGGAVWHIGMGTLAISDSQFWINNTMASNNVDGTGAVFEPATLPTDTDCRALLGGALLVRGTEDRDIAQGLAAAAGAMKSVQIGHVNFQGNDAVREGGAVYLKGVQDAVFADVSLTANDAWTGVACLGNAMGSGGRGGGIAAYNVGTVKFMDATFFGNAAMFGGGGGYFEGVGAIEFVRSDFSANRADMDAGGGALVKGNLAGAVTLSNVVFSDNTAAVLGGGIALMDLEGADMTMVRFRDNISAAGGGVAAFSITRLALINAEFDRNQGGHHGGGLLVKDHGSLAIHRGAWTNNRADWGSAMMACTRAASSATDRTMYGQWNTTMCGNLMVGYGSGPAGASGNTSLHDVTFDGNNYVTFLGEQLDTLSMVRGRFLDVVNPGNVGQFFLDGVLTTTVQDSEFFHRTPMNSFAGDFFVRERCGAPGVSSMTVRRTTFQGPLLLSGGASAVVTDGLDDVTLDDVSIDGYTTESLAAGLWSKGSNVRVANSRFTNNRSSGAGVIEIAPAETWSCGQNAPNVIQTVTIEDSLFEMNEARYFAGAVRIEGSRSSMPTQPIVTLEGSRFVDNGTRADSTMDIGGAVYVQRVGLLQVLDSEFVRNAITGGAGGGLAAHEVRSLLVRDSLFEGNSSGYRAGGLFAEASFGTWAEEMSLVRTTFRGNHTGTVGGGLSLSYAKHVNLQDCRFFGNTVGQLVGDQHYASGGGAYLQYMEQVDVHRTAFMDSLVGTLDSPNYNGGALAIDGVTTLNVKDSLFANNQLRTLPDVATCGSTGLGDCGRGRGGAILAKMRGFTAGGATSVLLNGCTFVNNGTPRSEAAVGVFKYSHDMSPTMVTSAVSVVNSIVWGNLPMGQGVVVTGEAYARVPADQTPVVASHTDIDETLIGTAMFNTVPMFMSPVPGDPFAAYHLQSGSPLVGAGDATVMSATDLLGESRQTPPAIGAIEIPD